MLHRLPTLFLAVLTLATWMPVQELSDVVMPGTEMREDDLPAVAAEPDGSVWLVWMAYADRRDEIAVRRWANGAWGNPQ